MSALPDPARLGYAGAELLRGAEERDEETLGRALADASARFHLLQDGRWLVRGTPAPSSLFDADEARALGGDPAAAVLLGWTPQTRAPRLALALPPAGAEPHPAIDLRTAGVNRSFPATEEGELAQAQALLTWHARTRFCGLCGAPTRPTLAGYRRDCTGCGATHFPRTDPVAIMLVHDGAGHCVLGRQPHFASGMWSCLAGFVEPGETLEDAVRREVAEEVGIAAGAVAYRLSQPWPFPGSLMIGCIAQASRSDLIVQESELEAARWFSREEVCAMIEGTHAEGLRVPPPYAIAHHLAQLFADGREGLDGHEEMNGV